MKHLLLFCPFAILLLSSCGSKKVEAPLFKALDGSRTGIGFNNRLSPKSDLNMLKYMYFYNGAGVGAGDFNGDGLADLFFAGNQVRNRLYLNKGDLRFEDVTDRAGIPDDGGWSTGVSVVDINNDGRLDVYVCRVGKYESLQSHNLLLVNTGIGSDGVPLFKDSAAAYGIDFSGFSTQAAFFDYDLDGDLDMYLMNHSLRYNSTFNERPHYKGTSDSLSGDRLYRNESGRYRDVTARSGINSTVIGYGLGICISDLDLDGYPDAYVANDFHENDYLYMNLRDGTFRDEGANRMMHTSQFSMGVDAADVNGDAYPEIVTLDMLPEDPYILRRSLGEDEYNLFRMKVRVGYQHQYARNNLQLNRGNGLYSEVGLYAGVAATDWSWAPLWMDFDNDGRKDLFISNGIPKRLNDIDYVNYISDDAIQARIRSNSMDSADLAFIEKFPQIRLRNKFFVNEGQTKFKDAEALVEGDRETYSNGAAYADLDNDGDLDIVVNNIDDEAIIYRNTTDDTSHIRITLKGPPANLNALGARVVLYSDKGMIYLEKYPVRGFQSSMESPLLLGTDSLRVDSLCIVWPDLTHQTLLPGEIERDLRLIHRTGLPRFDMERLHAPQWVVTYQDVSGDMGLRHRHEENDFVEFNREPLIPFMVSTEGPALAIGDANEDGRDDVYVGASKGYKSALWLQGSDGRFARSSQPALDADSVYEDVDAVWVDVNGDGLSDLVVASGGNEYYGDDEHLLPRLYLNQGGGRLARSMEAFREMNMTLSSVVSMDFDRDGTKDLFFGGRAVPFAYGAVPRSYLMLNDGRGRFREATERLAPGLSNIGMVKDAELADLDGDGDTDLVLALEWGNITAFLNQEGRYLRKNLSPLKGWWNFVRCFDADGDGDLDLVAGNHGLNSRLKATKTGPVRLYVNDFDDNGTRDQVLTHHLGGTEIPFANKAELEKQMPMLKKKFLYAGDFAKAGMSEIFGSGRLNDAIVLAADHFEHTLFINRGGGRFDPVELPMETQFSACRDAQVFDHDGDGSSDLMLFGNFHGNTVQMGRQDADFGSLLLNRGGGVFESSTIPGLALKGESRRVLPLRVPGGTVYAVARNNDSLALVSRRGNRPSSSPSASR